MTSVPLRKGGDNRGVLTEQKPFEDTVRKFD